MGRKTVSGEQTLSWGAHSMMGGENFIEGAKFHVRSKTISWRTDAKRGANYKCGRDSELGSRL